MPFRCDIRLDPVQLDRTLELPAHIQAWLVEPAMMVEPGTPLARLSMGGTLFDLMIRFRCQVAAIEAQTGVDLRPGDLLVRVAADGEEIPPGFRYCELA